MTRISRLLAVPATGAYYHEDLTPLKSGRPRADAQIVRAVPEVVSVGLVLDDGRVAWGDCAGMVEYDRPWGDAAFRAAEGIDAIRNAIAPALEGRSLTGFREMAVKLDALCESVEELRPKPTSSQERDDQVENQSRRALLTAAVRLLSPYPEEIRASRRDAEREEDSFDRVLVERPLHVAVRYGVSQALLQAVALARNATMADVIVQEWDLAFPDAPVPIHGLSGKERYLAADKMIVRRIASLPDAPVHDIPEQMGDEGFKLSGYVRWLVERLGELGDSAYRPTIHLDLSGAPGRIFDNDLGKVLGQLYSLDYVTQAYPLRVVDPVIHNSREAQIDALQTLRNYIRFRKMKVKLVADAWVNTLDDIHAFLNADAVDMVHVKMPLLGGIHNSIEAVLACKAKGVGALLGGSPAETDLSARVAVHVALATRPDVIAARPGVGVDEAVSLVQNEMARTLASIQAR
jgi:methylaspartate ammonia-lyase